MPHILARVPALYRTQTHTHTIITILLSPAPPFPSLFDSPLQSCLPVSKVPWCWRLGYPPLGHSTTASRRRAPRLGLPPFSRSNNGNYRYFNPVYRRVSAVRGAREVSSEMHRVCLVPHPRNLASHYFCLAS